MTYRDDLQAAKMRREALSRELRQVHSRMEEYQELARQEQELAQKLAQCARDMDQARARVELPLLQQVRVASPCKERWDDMSGDERVRFCGRCEKYVYDLSALTGSQAEALLRERGESMCVRFFRRSDGTVLTSDCPVGGGSKRFWRRVTKVAVASGLAAAGITMATATVGTTMGGIAPMPTAAEEWQGGLLPTGYAMKEKRDQRIADAQARLAAAMQEEAAIRQELDTLNAEVSQRENIAQHGSDQRKIEISEACRKNPLDC